MSLIAKIVTAIAWIAIIFNWISPVGGQMQSVLHYSGIFLIVAHFIEMLVFLPKAKQAGGNIALHAVQLFLFGYAHNLELDAKLKQQ